MKYGIALLIFAGVVCALLSAGCAKKNDRPAAAEQPEAGEQERDADRSEASAEKEAGTVIAAGSLGELTGIISRGGVIVVDFYADWCGPCKRLKPIIHGIAGKYAGRITVVSVNVDEQREAAALYEISSIPDVRIFNDGTQVKRFMGLYPENEYTSAIDSLVSK